MVTNWCYIKMAKREITFACYRPT